MTRLLAPLSLVVVGMTLVPVTMPSASAASSDACAVTGDTLDLARRAYADSCTLPRVDCDPVDGRWTCSSERIGRAAPVRAVDVVATPVVVEPVEPESGAAVPDETPTVVEPPAVVEPVVTEPQPVEPVAEQPTTPERRGGACEVTAPDLSAARNLYADSCSAARVDCDAIDGSWTCASYRIGLAAPGTSAPAPAEPPPVTPVEPAPVATVDPVPVAPVTPEPATPTTPAPQPVSGSLVAEAESIAITGAWRLTEAGIVYTGGNRFGLGARRDDANLSYVLTAPSAGTYQFRMRSRATSGGSEPPNDVWVRFGSLSWTKAYTPKPAQDWALLTVGEHDGKRGQNLLRSALPAGPVTVTISGRSTGHEIDRVELVRVGDTGAAPVAASSVYRDGDLLSLHHDSMPDADDLQAMITNRLVLDETSGIDYVMVHGAIGHRWTKTIDGSENLARQLFGDVMLNAKPQSLWGTDRYDMDTVRTVASLWQATLAAGDTVHVAEGGTSDFTALVLLELRGRGVSGLKNIRVVQHSAGDSAFNERETRDDRMALVKELATWVAIGNGNADNATPDFNQRDAGIEALARRSRYGAQWNYALDKIPSSRRMDFSDTVELLHILGIPKSSVPNVRAFADRYLK